jgi:Xaa-Pro aminopeptidase
MSTAELAHCTAAMERDGIDALVLGREAHARAVSDAERLWLAGTRAFAPGCVVVREPEAVHLLANSNAGFESFPPAHLYPITWNPERLFAALQAIPGFTTARRVGVDGMSPGMHLLFGALLPDAEIVDAGPLLAELWQVPTRERIAGVAEAARVARAGLEAMAALLYDGARARVLRGACAARFAALGVTTPAFEGVAAPIDGGTSSWLPPERLLGAGERVTLRAGALYHGWEASLARTYTVGSPAIELPPPAGWPELVAAVQTGRRVGELRERDAIVYGVGRGVEPYGDDLELAVGMSIAVELHRSGGIYQDVLQLTEHGTVSLTAA